MKAEAQEKVHVIQTMQEEITDLNWAITVRETATQLLNNEFAVSSTLNTRKNHEVDVKERILQNP